jgi:hypothetical protein
MKGQWGGKRPGAGRRKVLTGRPKDKGTAVATVPAEPKRRRNRINIERLLELSKQYATVNKKRPDAPQFNPFQLPAFPPNAMPKDKKVQMAMDDSLQWGGGQWAGNIFDQLAADGLQFLGYPFLSELAQRAEYRTASETIADDATRKWIDFEITGDESEQDNQKRREENDPEGEAERMADPDERKKRVEAAGKADKVKELKDDQERLEVRDRFYTLVRDDGLFGRDHLFMNFGDDVDGNPKELKMPIGDGRDKMSQGKIEKGSLQSLKNIEPMWVYPTTYNANNPLKDDWYKPQVWYVMGTEIDASRIISFVARPVPDILKPAYAFGGLALSQILRPYIDDWLKTKKSVTDLIHAFSVMVLSTDLMAMLEDADSGDAISRAMAFTALRDNQGVMMLNKATEEFKNVSAPISGLDALLAQSQEHVASTARIPLVKYTGLQPSGLNNSSESEITVYDDTISAFQNRCIRQPLVRVINFEQLSLWGKIDPQITIAFEPLRQLTEKERGENQKAEAERDQIYIDAGVLAPQEVRKKIANDRELPYADLDVEDTPDLREEEESGLEPQGGRPDPLAETGPAAGATGKADVGKGGE